MPKSKGVSAPIELPKQRATGKHTVQIGQAAAVTIVQVSGDYRLDTDSRRTRQGHRLTACGVRGGR